MANKKLSSRTTTSPPTSTNNYQYQKADHDTLP